MSSVLRKKTTPMPTNSSNSRQSSATRRRSTLTKPAWDSTNSNLDQFKASPDELERRKQAHQPKNVDTIKNDKSRQSILKSNNNNNNKKSQSTVSSLDAKKQLALLKEILFDDDQLKNLLLKSDATLKNASNLFDSNDNLLKRQAKINLTLAPNADLNDSILPQEVKRPSSNNSKHHQQQPHVLKTQNLNNSNSENELNNNENDDDSENKANINELIKYRQLLMEKKNVIEQQLKQKKRQNSLQSLDDLEKYYNTEINDDLLNRFAASNNGANSINDTNKINRIKSRIAEQQLQQQQQQQQQSSQLYGLSSSSSNSLSLNDFKKALEELENQLMEYEENTGRQISAQRISKHDTYSSYTISLVNVVSSLLQHLKQTTSELQIEKQKFFECTKQLDIHRKLIDGLTTEILSIKSQNDKLVNEFVNYEAKIETEMDQIRLMIRSSASRPSSFHQSMKPQSQQHFQQLQQQQHQQQPQSQILRATLVSPSNDIQTDYDKFSERLNAMLQTDIIPGSLAPTGQSANNQQMNSARYKQSNITDANMRPSSSLSRRSDYQEQQDQFDSFMPIQPASQQQLINNNQSTSRPTSTSFMSNNQNNLNNLLNTNKQIISDFNSQIQDLSSKNYEAQQKLKNLQQQQQQLLIENDYLSNIDNSLPNSTGTANTQVIHKLREDQQSLKEQILLLNKQREMAQRELDSIISNNNNTANDNLIATDSLQKLSSFGINMNSNNDHNRSSPNLSPIPTEALIQDPFSNQRFSNQLEITPPRNNRKK